MHAAQCTCSITLTALVALPILQQHFTSPPSFAAAGVGGGTNTAPPSMAGTAPASPVGSVASAASAPQPALRASPDNVSAGAESKGETEEQEFPLDDEVPSVPKAPVGACRTA